MSPGVIIRREVANNAEQIGASTPEVAIAFTVHRGPVVITQVQWMLDRVGTTDGTIIANIYNNTGTFAAPTVGTKITRSKTELAASSITTSFVWYTFLIGPLSLDPGEYLVSFEGVGMTQGVVRAREDTAEGHGSPNMVKTAATGAWASGSGSVDFRLEGTTTFFEGDFIRKDGSDEIEGVFELDPTNLFGIAAEGDGDAIESGFVTIYELSVNHWLGMMGTRDPVAGDVGTDYGVVRSGDGQWVVDYSETTNTRVTVKAVDTDQNYAYVVPLAAHIQA